MRQCLTSDLGGYYTRQVEQSTDHFGRTGDFITSPEISQVFGELIGIWFVAEWMSQGRRGSGVQLMELGPGRGSLMGDILRTLRNFKTMASALETIYLVESSPSLRAKQHSVLCGDEPMDKHEIGFKSKSKHLPTTSIIWTEDLNFIPKDNSKSPFIVAHEFFDALPIHAFQSTPTPRQSSTLTTSSNPASSTVGSQSKLQQNEWRELQVIPKAPPSPFSKTSEAESGSKAEFELSLSTRPTPYSQLLPNLSPRYKKLLSSSDATIEISESARILTGTLSQFIGGFPSQSTRKAEPSGSAIIIDYGPTDTVPVNTLRGIKAHKLVSPFESPGLVDLSADVDFGALVEAALDASEDIEVHGPVDQAFWLGAMGGEERVKALTGNQEKESADRITQSWKRLVDRGPNGMGKLYKALAIVPNAGGKRRPVGFGGGLTI